MLTNTMRMLVAGTAALALGGCSTILRGTSEKVSVETPGISGATCHLTGGDGVDASVTTPGEVQVSKSKADIKVICTAPDGRIASSVFASSYSDYSYVQWPGGYLVDGASGAMWVYPKTFAVPFGGVSAPAPGHTS